MVGGGLLGDGDFVHGFVGGEEYDVVIAEQLSGPIDKGHFFDAGFAPGRPKVEDDVFSLEIADLDLGTIGGEESPCVDIGLRCAVIFPHIPQAQEEEEQDDSEGVSPFHMRSISSCKDEEN